MLSLTDQFVYHYLTVKVATVVGPLLEWSAYKHRFSYRLATSGRFWFENEFSGWRNFDTVSLARIAAGASHVLVSDIAGYYENIDIGRLVQELQAAVVDLPVCRQLSSLWNKWAATRQRGVPQGFGPSHVYGEFFLDPIDRALVGQGISHLRYMDDIRIFTGSEVQARQALQELSRLLRERGLNVHTGKTEILTASEARRRFSVVQVSLLRVSREIARELAALVETFPAYVDPETIREYLRADPNNPRPEVVERAWEAFVVGHFGDFNKTMLHYLLSRLAESGSSIACEYCLSLLERRPEETLYVLDYFTQLLRSLPPSVPTKLAELLSSSDLVFDYQRYLILRWFHEADVGSPAVLEFCRHHVGHAASLTLRPHAIAYLGRHADGVADHQRLTRGLESEVGELMRGTYLAALRSAAPTVRNLLYGRCAGESELVNRALRWAKANVP